MEAEVVMSDFDTQNGNTNGNSTDEKPEIIALAQNTINKISAGEIVESPVKVIKELIENSVDAKAKNISIYIENGGLDLIKIVDDGVGIKPVDLPSTVKRYATSKIRKVEDIFNTLTFGFRGEALSAISAVSVFTITSMRKGYEPKELRMNDGEPEIVNALPIDGTSITAKKLFYNTPARRKFLKSATAYKKEITQLIKLFAIFNTSVSVKFYSDDKLVFSTLSQENMLQRSKKLFDEEELTYSSYIDGIIKLDIVASSPLVQKTRRDNMFFAINGRLIKDQSLMQAIIQAYHRRIPEKSYPMIFVSLTIDPHEIDVNVHPSKEEIKFFDQSKVFVIVRNGISKHLDELAINKFKDDNGFNINDSINKYDEDGVLIENVKDDSAKSETYENIDVNSNTRKQDNGTYPLPKIFDSNKNTHDKTDNQDTTLLGGLSGGSFIGGSGLRSSSDALLSNKERAEKLEKDKHSSELSKLASETVDFFNKQFADIMGKVSSNSGLSADIGLGNSFDNNNNNNNKQKEYTIENNIDSTSKTSKQPSSQQNMTSATLETASKYHQVANLENELVIEADSIPTVNGGKINVLSQLSNMYILCEVVRGVHHTQLQLNDTVLMIIDQHVAHERILYDKYSTNKKSNTTTIILHAPIKIELNQQDQQITVEHKDELNQYGYYFEPSTANGKYYIILEQIPTGVLAKDVEKHLKSIINDLANEFISRTEDHDRTTKACKDAIKAGEPLSMLEMKNLVEELFKTSNPYTCPHGRPIIINVTQKTLLSGFHRI